MLHAAWPVCWWFICVGKCWRSTYYPTYHSALPVAPVGMRVANALTLFDAGLQEKLALTCDVLSRECGVSLLKPLVTAVVLRA